MIIYEYFEQYLPKNFTGALLRVSLGVVSTAVIYFLSLFLPSWTQMIAWITAICILLASMGVLINYFRRPHGLIISEQGINDYTRFSSFGDTVIPWEAIGLIEVEGNSIILYVDNPQVLNERLTGLQAFIKPVRAGESNSRIDLHTGVLKLENGQSVESLAETLRNQLIAQGQSQRIIVSFSSDIAPAQ